MTTMKKKQLPLTVVVVVVIAAAMLPCTAAELIYVGDKKGWAPNVNYTEWASHQHFHVEDWLLFRFDKNQYNVVEVNETNYKNCNDQEFITNITKGGRDVFQLREARPYYFLSRGGACYQGMKLAITVDTLSPQAPAPPPPANNAFAKVGAIWFVLSMIMLATMSIPGLGFY